MHISYVKLKNWRNFQTAEANLREYTYLLGANASGKSNFLDVFRFLRDISKEGGGLQKALTDRGGLSKIRCLHARADPEVEIELHLKNNFDDDNPAFKYILALKNEGSGAHRVLITKECVIKSGRTLIDRPIDADKKDNALLTQTHLEQIQANAKFRELSDFFSEINYLHLVPQLLKYHDQIGGRLLDNDPFGQGFLNRIARTNARVRDARLRRIQDTLKVAVPQFGEIKFEQDQYTGHPHLVAKYIHHRPKGAWQREEQFSDGTLRLIGLLWSLQEGQPLLLLEEPELSLNDGIVAELPLLFDKIKKKMKKKDGQIIISTHSPALLDNRGIDARGVLLLEPNSEGTRIRSVNTEESKAIAAGFSVADAILPKTHPKQLVFKLS